MFRATLNESVIEIYISLFLMLVFPNTSREKGEMYISTLSKKSHKIIPYSPSFRRKNQ